jgi:hypothetical protein
MNRDVVAITAADLVRGLSGVRGKGPWTALCPAHDDTSPSLSFEEKNGKVLWRCHAGCSQQAVTDAIYAKLGVSRHTAMNGNGRGDPVATYTYTDASGLPVFYRDRFEWLEKGEIQKAVYPRQLDGKKAGVAPVPYRLHRVLQAIDDGATIIIAEGEKCVDALEANGYVASTTGSATSWKGTFAAHFKNARVVLWPDADGNGEKYIANVAGDLRGIAAELRVLRFAGKSNGWDAADYFSEGGTEGQLDELLADAPDYVEAAAPPRRFKLLLDSAPPPPPQAQISNLTFVGEITLDGAAGGDGKGVVEISMAIHTILGTPVFGTLEVKRPGVVALIMPEDGEAVLWNRIYAVARGMGLTAADVHERLRPHLWVWPDDEPLPNLADAGVVADLGADLRAVQPVLLIGDPLSHLIAGEDENNQRIATAVCDNLKRFIARPMNTAVWLSGHTRKPDRSNGAAAATGFDFKGSVGWRNGGRALFIQTKNADRITIALEKANWLPPELRHELRLEIEANPENAADWISCRLTDANYGAASIALTPGVGRALNANELALLDALNDDHEPGKHFSWAELKRVCGSEDSTKSVKTRLLEFRLIEAHVVREKAKRKWYDYTLSDAGRDARASHHVRTA